MQKFFNVSLILIASISFTFAQEGTIRGTIKDAKGPAEARCEEDAAVDVGSHRRRRQRCAARAVRGDRRSPGVNKGQGRGTRGALGRINLGRVG